MALYSDNDALFISKLDDGVYLCEKRRRAYFFPFLSEREQMIARRHLDGAGFHSYAFSGGYDSAERKMLGLFFENREEPFPLCAVGLEFRRGFKLTHRDFLGALMSLGIERETVGDILVEDGRCVIFVKEEIKDYVTSQLFKVGNVGVKITGADPGDLPQGRGFDEKECTVASLRLDAVVAAMTGLSREKTKSLVLSELVSLNHSPCRNTSQPVSEKDVITVRGKGKYIINGVLGETKKHRIKLSVIHYR